MKRDELRQALDDSMLMRTGRSIGDLASQRVVDDIWPLIEAYEAHEAATSERPTLTREWLEEARVRAIADIMGERDYLRRETDRLRAERDAALEIVRAVAESHAYTTQNRMSHFMTVLIPPNDVSVDELRAKARALLAAASSEQTAADNVTRPDPLGNSFSRALEAFGARLVDATPDEDSADGEQE